ncbi:MAG TPA: ABC transporter substrate-binding protein, partial [Clostridiaceae bacterium]|nr:ABC transporter substrate-binding protein [Clostridiaceae bacterium]
MKKRIFITFIVCVLFMTFSLTGCSNGQSSGSSNSTSDTNASKGEEKDNTEVTDDPNAKVINLWSFTDEVPNMMKKYKDLHPDFPYKIKTTIIATTDG